jgi:hypothetical protein
MRLSLTKALVLSVDCFSHNKAATLGAHRRGSQHIPQASFEFHFKLKFSIGVGWDEAGLDSRHVLRR